VAAIVTSVLDLPSIWDTKIMNQSEKKYEEDIGKSLTSGYLASVGDSTEYIEWYVSSVTYRRCQIFVRKVKTIPHEDSIEPRT
jgi:hypothetical protein